MASNLEKGRIENSIIKKGYLTLLDHYGAIFIVFMLELCFILN